MPQWVPFLTVFSMGTMLGLMVFVIMTNYRTWLGSACIGMCLTFALWALGLYNMVTLEQASGRILWHQISAIGWCFFPLTFLLFALEISSRGTRRNRLLVIFGTGLPGLLFLLLIWMNPMLYIGRFSRTAFGWGMTKPGDSPVLVASILFLAFSGATGVFLLTRWGQRTRYRQEKKQAFRLSATAAFTLCASTVTDLILPILDIPTPGMTPVFVLPFFMALFYSAYRYHLLDVTPVVSVSDVMRRVRDLMVVLDRDGKILQLNVSARETLGYGMNELQGFPLSRILPDYHLPQEDRLVETEASLMDSLGNRIPVQMAASPRFNPDGDCVGYILTASDMRTRLALELEGIERHLAEERHRDETLLFRLALEQARLGFLVVGSDQRIGFYHSTAVRDMFGVDKPDGMDFADLFLPSASPEEREQVRRLLDTLFTEARDWRQKALLKLLPETLGDEGRMISLHYCFPDALQTGGMKTMLILMEDCTEVNRHERDLSRENERLTMVMNVLRNREAFHELLEECSTWHLFVSHTSVENVPDVTSWLVEYHRNIHTFKGGFLRFGMQQTAAALMRQETFLTDLLRHVPTLSDIRRVMMLEGPDAWMEQDMRMLKETVGPECLSSEEIGEQERHELEHVAREMERHLRMAGITPETIGGMLQGFRELYSFHARQLLLEYGTYVQRISGDRHLPEPEFVVHGMDMLLECKRYKPFFRTLVHLFNNIVAHAIESPEERKAMSKPERAHIECLLENRQDFLVLEIADDGRGMDAERLREQWNRRNVADGKQIVEEDQEILQHIFEPGYTTTLTPDTLSGRGIGLFAIAHAVHQLGGTVRVRSSQGAYTKFQFRIPLKGQ